MRKRRILLLIKGLGRGGAEQILASSTPHLDTERFHYEVAYVLPWKDALVKELEDAGVETRCLDGSRGIAWVGRLRRLVMDECFDLVHTHSPVAASLARVALGSDGSAIVHTEHNVWERYHRATYWSNMLTFPRNRHVFAVSDHVRASIRYPQALVGLRMPPVETLYHGIDQDSIGGWFSPNDVREELGIPADAPVVGTVANFKSHKRLDQLLHAAKRVRREVPAVRFVLVGQGQLEMQLRGLTHQLGLDDTVVFTGFREDAQRVCSAFDVFALSSEHEGLSIALIEALALGKPAVVTEVGGLTEVIQHERQGYTVPLHEPATFADRIAQLLRDPELRSRMGQEGRLRAETFDIRRSVRRMERVYEEILS
jgi:glycosyltransferase involved in cell wall biosynthesis